MFDVCTVLKTTLIMEKEILKKLREIEIEKDIEILFAVESGSRAWGFESPDSDYDIRFVYKHKREWYLNLWEQKDTIEFMTDLELDGSGWDIRKALKLLSKSNASFLGWLFSPVVYRGDKLLIEELRQLAINNFNPVSGFYHYNSMNKGFEKTLGTKEMTLKSFFYTIRTALCANWICKRGTVPPVYFKELYPLIDKKYHSKLDSLILEKSKLIEKSTAPVSDDLVALVREVIKENNVIKSDLKPSAAFYEDFNTFFIKTV